MNLVTSHVNHASFYDDKSSQEMAKKKPTKRGDHAYGDFNLIMRFLKLKRILSTSLASLSIHKIFCVCILARIHEEDLDLVSTFLVRSLVFSKDVTAAAIWFILLDIRVFCCCLFCSLQA